MDDFLYLCDDAYTHQDILKMEQDILCVLDYDINMPVAYRFLRRLARVRGCAAQLYNVLGRAPKHIIQLVILVVILI